MLNWFEKGLAKQKKERVMNDIWNPWHGCVKCSEGCEHCYMYFLDRMRDHDGRQIYNTKAGLHKPFQRVQSGMAYKPGVSFQGKPVYFNLRDT